jgi:hypothetical protein
MLRLRMHGGRGSCEVPRAVPEAFDNLASKVRRLALSGQLDLGADLSAVSMLELERGNVSTRNVTRMPLPRPVGQVVRVTMEAPSLFVSHALHAFTLSYNGLTSEELFLDDEPSMVRTLLEKLPTIGTVAVNRSTAADRLELLIEFTSAGTPLNAGPLPALGLNASELVGASGKVTVEREGTSPVGYTYDEQTIELRVPPPFILADLIGGFTLAFQLFETEPITPGCTAHELAIALRALASIGEIEVFKNESKSDEATAVYTVRFYPDGQPAHVGTQPQLWVNVSGLGLGLDDSPARRRRLGDESLSIESSVSTAVVATSPFDGDDNEALMYASEESPSNASEVTLLPVEVLPVVHVCGNGWRSSAEVRARTHASQFTFIPA